MTMLHGVIQSLSRWALVPVAALALAACGGGEPDLPQAGGPPGPATFVVDAPPATPTLGPGDIASATQASPTGTLPYMVFSASSAPAGSTPQRATATITHSVAASHDITFTSFGDPPAPSLTISKDLTEVAPLEKWNGVYYNGGVPNRPLFSGADCVARSDCGLLSGGNFFVYCSAGASYQWKGLLVAPSILRAGAQVAISGNFVAMTDIAPLYGKTFKRFDCTDTAPDTTFGDRDGNLTMAFGSLKLSPAQVTEAFSTAGLTISDVTYKRRAYQWSPTNGGAPEYIIVALDKDAAGKTTASVLYKPD